MQVVVNSLLTNYVSQGTGPVVLLIHGWGDNLRSFSILQKELSADFRVISLDLPGFGNSQAPQTTWDLDDFADFLADFLTKLGIEKVRVLIGHSNGAAVAIRGVATEKLGPEKLVLLAASGIRTGKTFKKAVFWATAKVGKVASLALPPKTRAKLRQKLYKSAKSDMLVAQHMQEAFKRVISQDVQSDAKKVALPTLLIYGQGDTETPAIFGIAFHRLIKDSSLLILDGAAHFVHQDQPEVVHKAIKKFLG